MARHQSHNVANRNAANLVARAAPFQPPINVSAPHRDPTSVFDLDGRLCQVQEREIDWKVPVTVMEREAVDVDKLRNPINQLGALHSACVPIVTSNDPISYAAAVNKRSNFMQAGAADDVGDQVYAETKPVIAEQPRLFEMWEENDYDRHRWEMKFDEGKRARMRKAWLERPEATLNDLRRKTGSVKVETLNGKRFDDSAAGRIIYAGSDVFNAVTGPAQMVAMERLVATLDHVNVDGTPNTVGGIQVKLCYKCDDKETAAFIIDDRFKQIVEGDFSRNDREQRRRVALITDEWFEKLGFPTWYRQLMLDLDTYTLTNYDFGLQVRLMYQLATGTTNTTFRNSVYNATMFGVVARRQKVRGKALILGDDILAALNKRLCLKKWVATVAEFKMVLKAKAPELDGHATILSRRIFAEVEVPFMVPLLGKMLVRFNARANQNPSISDSTAMAAKALSYAFGCQNVHLLRDIFLRRFEMEDGNADVSVADLGWQTRSMGHELADIKRIVMNAPNLVDDDSFSFWCTKVYDLDYLDVVELFEMTVLDTTRTILEDPRIDNMRRDFD